MTALDALVLTLVTPLVALYLYTTARVLRVRYLGWRWEVLDRRAGRVCQRMMGSVTEASTEASRRAIGKAMRAHRRYEAAVRELGF